MLNIPKYWFLETQNAKLTETELMQMFTIKILVLFLASVAADYEGTFVDHMCGFIIFYLNYIFDFTDETKPVLYDNKVS